MKARLLKKWGANYAGQVLTNVQEGSIPDGVAEFYEDDDPAVNTVVEQQHTHDPLMVINDEINPEHAKAHDEAQRASAEASQTVGDRTGINAALEELEREQTQDRARNADDFAAGRIEKGKASLSEGQKKAMAAGKEPANMKHSKAPKQSEEKPKRKRK